MTDSADILPDQSPHGARAAVFAGGGVAGIAWMLGMTAGLAADGVELRRADTLIGTSAGSAVAMMLAAGQLGAAVDLQLAEATAERMVAFDFEEYLALLTEAREGGPGEPAPRSEAAGLRRIANLPQVGEGIPREQRRAVIEARLPGVVAWPEQRVLITTVDAELGELVAFDASSGVSPADAVEASCALPGIWPNAEIGGRRYVDGGIRSGANADLATGAAIVAILIPTAINDDFRTRLDAEIASLALRHPAHVIAADEASLAAIGSNGLDPATRRPAFEAGRRQAAAESAALAPFWG